MTSVLGTATSTAIGFWNFTNFGYERTKKHAENWENIDLYDLSGKTYIVTGSNSGTGYSTAEFLATHGGTVHLVCRDLERGMKALEQIRDKSKNPKVFLHIVDLSEPDQIRTFVKSFIQDGNSLDVLINNAGAMSTGELEFNSQGQEKTLATNTFGPFLLTNQLIPLLSKSSDPRVITVSSGGMLTQNLVVRDDYLPKDDKFDPKVSYARTKRHETVLTELWNEKYSDTGITFTSMHPGIVDTKAVRVSMPTFFKLTGPILRTLEQGSDTIKWLAVSKSAHGNQVSGNFFRDRQVEMKHAPLAKTEYTEQQKQELWDWCSQSTKWFESEIKPSA